MSKRPEIPSEPPSPWREFLADLDRVLSEPVELHCVGGFVVSVVYGFHQLRTTGDLDYTAIEPQSQARELEEIAGRGSKLSRKYGVSLEWVNVGDVPSEYETRLVDVFAGLHRNLRLRVLDPYDLVLSKLTRNYPIDNRDVQFLAKALRLDPEVLENRYREELRPYIMTGDPRWHDQTLRIWLDEFFSRYG